MKYLIKNAHVINEGLQYRADVLINNGLIEKISTQCNLTDNAAELIDATGLYLVPGAIDDQVHFREPGLTHKGNIHSESAAAVAGGITSFMEMPNTVPNTLTQDLLAQKYQIATNSAIANYSFYMGASNDNLEEVLKTNNRDVCGVKIFMGSSTGNMLVDSEQTLENIFSKVPMLIATHCEDEATIRANTEKIKSQYGEDLAASMHPVIRNVDACYISSSKAVELAKKHNTRLHILHISTAKELSLFDHITPLAQKRITAEACVHHLWFDDSDYERLGMFLKWNPAVKSQHDRDSILKAVTENYIDVIATDHAPHTIEEKQNSYFKAPSGGPLAQHSLVAMLELSKQGKITIEKVVEKMSHAPAVCFQIEKRGYIREGYHADLVLLNPNNPWTVNKSNIVAMCGWSPFEGTQFSHAVTHTFVSGQLAYVDGNVNMDIRGQRLLFNRN